MRVEALVEGELKSLAPSGNVFWMPLKTGRNSKEEQEGEEWIPSRGTVGSMNTCREAIQEAGLSMASLIHLCMPHRSLESLMFHRSTMSPVDTSCSYISVFLP